MIQMGLRIHNERKKIGYTLDEVVERTGIPKATLSRLENGKLKTINRSYVDRLAKLFDVDAAYLLGYEDGATVNLTYSSHGKEDINMIVDSKPILGESSLRAKLLQEAAKIPAQNLQAALDIIKALQ